MNAGRGTNIKYLPYAYTEQGVSMLTSVLHTDRAIAASIQIIEAFVEMAHYLQNNSLEVPAAELYYLAKRQTLLEAEVSDIRENMLVKADLPTFIQLFDRGVRAEEVLILDGEPLKADVAYQEIYGRAKKSIVVVDDYISAKTLHHLAHASEGVSITVISDNKARPPLTAGELRDFTAENPRCEITFVRSMGRVHDRYIALDLGTPDERIYHCGASSKDAGKRITTISRLADAASYTQVLEGLLANPPLDGFGS